MTATVLVAEDEPLLRQDLVNALSEVWPECLIVAEAGDGAEALDAIAAHRPRFAFLDIRMPGLTGLDVAAALADTSPQTRVVFVTAYQQYAVDAFERGAIDYLLKPIDRARLSQTVARLKNHAAEAPTLDALEDALRALSAAAPARAPLTWIAAGSGRDTRLIMVDDVLYFQADNKYTVVMTTDGEALIRTPIRELLDSLDPRDFKQVHRSTIVNLRAVKSVSREENGRGTIRFKVRSETVQVSQPFMHLFRSM